MKKSILFLTAGFLLAVFPSERLYSQPDRSLRETFDFYVKSVQDENLEDLFSVVSDREDFFFLTSRGELIDSRKGYYKFHQDWFEEDNWEMPVKFVSMNEGREYSYTLATYYYKTELPDGRIYHLDSYFTLIFHKEDNQWKVIGDVCTPISRYYSSDSGDITYSQEQEYLIHIMRNRRTVRKYKDTPVPEEHILKILDAARMCPTAGNQQPWKFLVIRDREKLDRLEVEAGKWFMDKYSQNEEADSSQLESIKAYVATSISNALSAPVYVAVLADTRAKYGEYIIYDGILAAGYLMIAARSLGYGTGFFTSFFPGSEMKKFLKIPDPYKLICFTPIGIPGKWPETPEKKDLDELIVWEAF